MHVYNAGPGEQFKPAPLPLIATLSDLRIACEQNDWWPNVESASSRLEEQFWGKNNEKLIKRLALDLIPIHGQSVVANLIGESSPFGNPSHEDFKKWARERKGGNL